MTTLLFVGDLHLGRTPWRLGGSGLDLSRLGPAEAWRRCVDHALDTGIDAVVLAGDVVDQAKDRFEAYGHLERGVRRLADAGVAVIGVAGNHDHVALPRLVRRIDAFQLLGGGGRWERVEIEGVDLLGWSFPGSHHHDDPLHAPGLDLALENRRGGVPLIGVLHADLDAAGGGYAPTRSQVMKDLPVDRWFLGHIHRPDPLDTSREPGYLGSLVGLDRGEPGLHGPWRVTVLDQGHIEVEQALLGPVLWTTIDIDVSSLVLGDDAEDELHQAMEQAFRRHLSARSEFACPHIDVVGCSIQWTGRCTNRAAISRFHQLMDGDARAFHLGDQIWMAVSLQDATRAAHDLQTLATESTPIGLVADLLLRLDQDGEAAVPDIMRRRIEAMGADAWVVDREAPPAPPLVELAKGAALRTLDALMAQRSSQGGV